MKTQIKCMMALIMAGIVAGCAGPKAAQRSAKGQLLQDAERYVSELREHNSLPGFSGSEHGRLIAAAPWAGGSVSYPLSVSVQAWKEGQTASYRYELAKAAAQAPWHLVGAARLDTGGRVVEDLLAK